MGNIGKFIAVLALNLENSLVTGDRRVVFFIRFDRDRRIFAGELADNIGKKLGIKSDFPRSRIVPSTFVSIPSSISLPVSLISSETASIRMHSRIGIVVLEGTAFRTMLMPFIK